MHYHDHLLLAIKAKARPAPVKVVEIHRLVARQHQILFVTGTSTSVFTNQKQNNIIYSLMSRQE